MNNMNEYDIVEQNKFVPIQVQKNFKYNKVKADEDLVTPIIDNTTPISL